MRHFRAKSHLDRVQFLVLTAFFKKKIKIRIQINFKFSTRASSEFWFHSIINIFNISQLVLDRMRSGEPRDGLTRRDLSSALDGGDGGDPLPCVSHLRRSGVRVRAVPFLPLSREHVRQCARREIRSQGLDATEEDVEAVVGQLAFFSEDFPVLARSGCKQVAGKVDVYLGGRGEQDLFRGR